MSNGFEIRRQAHAPKHFAAVGLASPEGRPLIVHAEPWFGTRCTDDPEIRLWAEINQDIGSTTVEEDAAADAEQERLEDEFRVIAGNVTREYGFDEDAVLKALAEGLSMVSGRQVTVEDVKVAVEADEPNFWTRREQYLLPICRDAHNEMLENEEKGHPAY